MTLVSGQDPFPRFACRRKRRRIWVYQQFCTEKHDHETADRKPRLIFSRAFLAWMVPTVASAFALWPRTNRPTRFAMREKEGLMMSARVKPTEVRNRKTKEITLIHCKGGVPLIHPPPPHSVTPRTSPIPQSNHRLVFRLCRPAKLVLAALFERNETLAGANDTD